MTARTVRAEPGGRIAVLKCPLCTFEHVEILAPISNDALAGVFGTGVMRAAAVAQHHEKIELALRTHLSTHSLAEWVAAVTSRDERIADLITVGQRVDDQLAELVEGLNTRERG